MRVPSTFFGMLTVYFWLKGIVLDMREKTSYWFNTKTKEVEVGPQSIALDRLGPFDSRQEAERAEELVAERARRIREEDEAED